MSTIGAWPPLVVAEIAKAGPRGPKGEDGADGSDISTRTTLLEITGHCPAGSSFFVNSDGTNYTLDPTSDEGFLGETEEEFLTNEKYQVVVGCLWVNKKGHIQWVTPYSFNLLSTDLYNGDFIKIIS